MKKIFIIFIFLTTILIIQYKIAYSQDWTTPEIVFISTQQYNSYLEVIIDNDNIIHFVWAADIDFDKKPDSLYYFHKRDAYRSNLISVGTNSNIMSVAIALDLSQKLHILWGETLTPDNFTAISKIYYSHIENLKWQEPTLVADLSNMESSGPWEVKLFALSANSLLSYWMVTLPTTIMFSYFDNNQWSLPFKPFPDYSFDPKTGGFGDSAYPDLARSIDGKLHITFIGRSAEDKPPPGANFISPIIYAVNDLYNRDWENVIPRKIHISTTESYNYPKIAISDNNTRYVFWTVDKDLDVITDDIYYSYSTNNENWSQPKTLTNKMSEFITEPFPVADQSGNIRVFWRCWLINSVGKFENRYYYTIVNRDSFSDYEEIPNMDVNKKPHSVNLIIDKKNREHIFWAEHRTKSDSSGIVIKHMWRDLPTGVFEKNPTATDIGFPSNINVSAYPNPFNESTTLIIELSKPSLLTLSIYNINGQLVNVLLSEKFIKSNFQLMWNGTDQNGNNLSSGVYWYLLKASAESGLQKKIQSGKLVLLR